MKPTRTRLLAALVVLSLCLLLAAGVILPNAVPGGSTGAEAGDERPANPTTEGTVGYVEGYWYDDELAVDDRNTATVSDAELKAVVYRSMARVERIRGHTFKTDVPVKVISRETYRKNNDDVFANTTGNKRIQLNVNTEALFAVDRGTNATAEQKALYGGAVDGYYKPSTNQIIIVSDNPESPQLNEATLGHELTHALQDQQFNLSGVDRRTQDQTTAKNGLVEGDATRVESEYKERCGTKWDCIPSPDGGSTGSSDLNWVLYMMLYQPYDDGPDYIDHLLDQGGWSAVDAAYDDPPDSSSEVIHPGTERNPATIEINDRSNKEWHQFRVNGTVANETFGEAAMVSMFGANALDPNKPSVINRSALFESTGRGYDYDQPYTDGWAGDKLVVYATNETTTTDNPSAAVTHTGYVWRTKWVSSTDSRQFVDGYLQLLDLYGAKPVDGRQDTYVIDDEFPGAYYIDRTGKTVTIVRAPSVEDLPEVNAGAAPNGTDTLEDIDAVSDDGVTNESGTTDGSTDGSDTIPGFGVAAAIVAVLVGVLVVCVRTGIERGP